MQKMKRMSEQEEIVVQPDSVLDELNYQIERSVSILDNTTQLKDQFENLKRLYDFIMIKQENGYNADYERYKYSKELEVLQTLMSEQNVNNDKSEVCGKRKRDSNEKSEE